MMIRHEVKPGDCLASIAKEYGFSDWRTLYDHDDNADLRIKRPNPNLLNPGDVVVIPEKSLRVEEGQTEKRHRFVRRQLPIRLRIKVLDDRWLTAPNRPYTLTVNDHVYSGITDATGLLDHPKAGEPAIPADAKEGLLEVDFGKSPNGANGVGAIMRYRLLIGSLDPHDQTGGVRERLNNIGLCTGTMEEEANDKLANALNVFRRHAELPECEGRGLDQETCSSLERFHDHKPNGDARADG